MTELFERMPEGTGWYVTAVILLLLFGAPAIASKETANSKLWLFGAVARWIQRRKERSIERERALNKTQATILRDEIAELRGWIQEDREEHSKEIAGLRHSYSKQISELRTDIQEERKLRRRIETKLQSMVDEMWDYIEWGASWAREVILMAQQEGWSPPLRPWYSFHEWRAAVADPPEEV